MNQYTEKLPRVFERPDKTCSRMLPQCSLKQSCLGTVSDFLLSWSKNTFRQDFDPENAEKNPFFHYPIHLRQDMLNSLVKVRPDGKQLLRAAELLVGSGIESFDLGCIEDCKFPDVRMLLDILINHGRTLRELRIAGHWLYRKESASLLQRLLESTPNLQRLQLQHTTKGGKELETIARQCGRLHTLEILHPSLDEQDILSLTKKIRKDGSFWAMRDSLNELRVPSSVNGKSILVLLETFHNIEYLHCGYLEQMLDEFSNFKNSTFWVQRLSHLRGIQATHPLGDDSVCRLVQWCPNLREISLEVQEGMSLIPIAKLTHLQFLQLRNSPTLPASYTEEVLPLLKACGERIHRLNLEQFDVVDLVKTALTCPNLRAFNAQWFTILGTGTIHGNVKPFLKLRFLRLRPQVNRRITPDAIKILLRHCQGLRYLELYCSHGLNDPLATWLIQQNPLQHLRTLILRHGHGLSINGVHTITNSATKLKFRDLGRVCRC